MGRMEGVPTVDKICRDELHLDDYVIARLKELIKLFRKAYEISEGVNFASEGMMDWTSSEISNMTAKFLDYDTNPHRSPRQRRFSAGEELWDPTKGYVLEFPSDKDEISRGLNRLFARQNKYRSKNLAVRGEQRKKGPESASPHRLPTESVEGSDLPDVDELIQARTPSKSRPDKEGSPPQTRSGKPYNDAPPMFDANPGKVNTPRTPFTAPVAPMMQPSNWGFYKNNEREIKHLVDSSANATGSDGAEASKKGSRTSHAQQTVDTASPPLDCPSDASNTTERSEDFFTVEHGSESAAGNDNTAREINDYIDNAMPALDSIKDHHKSQGKGNTPVSTTGRPRKVVALRFGQSRKRPLPKRADIGKSTTINSENQRTESESSEEEDSKPTQNAAKRLKRDKDVEDVSSASKPREESVITEGDKTNPVRVEDSTGPGSPKSPVHDLRQQSRSARIADNLPRNQRNPKRKPDSLSRPRQAPGTRSKAKTHLSQTIRSHSLPPTPAEDFNATFKGHADREMSHTLEPEPISRRAVRAERLFRDKNVQSSTRKTRVAVEFWILVTGVPKRAWIQWSDASLSTQTVRTMFQTLNEYSHLRDIEAADVQFQTSEETWTFRIKEGDEEKFEDMKSHIKTRVQASLTKNRNRNQNFFIHISPIGVDEVADNLEGDVAFENIEGW